MKGSQCLLLSMKSEVKETNKDSKDYACQCVISNLLHAYPFQGYDTKYQIYGLGKSLTIKKIQTEDKNVKFVHISLNTALFFKTNLHRIEK